MDNLYYNAIQGEIVNFLKDRKILDRYIINIPKGKIAGSVFTRNTRFSAKSLLAFMIMPRTESTAVELARFAEITGSERVCKQTFFLKRRHVSPGIFGDINRRCILDLYRFTPDLNKWRGMLLLSFDGTTLKLPDTEEMRTSYPKGYNQKGEYSQPLARMEILRDSLNGAVLDTRVEGLSGSETGMAKNILENLAWEMKESSVFLFDRGYLGAAWFTWLQLNDIQYVVRLPRGFNKDVDSFFDSDEDMADVEIRMSAATWYNKGKGSFDRFGLDSEKCPPLMLHLVKCRLESGEPEVLALRINEHDPSPEELRSMYAGRWEVETSIDELKNQLQLEIFSGNSPLCVQQDIMAKIVAYNIGITLARKATASMEPIHPDKYDGKGSHVRRKVNLNIGWHYLKKTIVRLLMSDTAQIPGILTETVKDLKRNCEEYTLGRHEPHRSRRGSPRGKYVTFTNYRRSI